MSAAQKLKIAYGTYGMPKDELQAVLPRLAQMGYEGVEICVGEKYPTNPDNLSKAVRREIRSQFSDLNLEIPALMPVGRAILSADPAQYKVALDAYRAAAELATDLALNDTVPPLASTLGGRAMTWEEDKEELADRLAEVGEVVAKAGSTFALEPHVGSVLDDPDNAIWLVERIASPAVRLNFDISHFAVAGYPMEETVKKLAPYAIHTHVKDGRMVDGKVQWLLPGEGDFDYTAYFRAMAETDFTGCITVEISGMIFNKPDYDAWVAAEFSWKTLSTAREQA